LIFTAAGTIGQVALIPFAARFEEYIISNKQMRVRLDLEKVDTFYAYYWFSCPMMNAYIKRQDTGSTIPLINLSVLRALPIPLPPLQEQRTIATILKSLDDKIGINHQTNQTLEQMAQAIFKSWFVDFEPVKAKIAALEASGSEEGALLAAMQAISGKCEAELSRLQVEQPEQYAELRATAELFPSAMQDSELGEIPEGWSITPVGEILDRLKPKRRYTKKQVAPAGSVPVFEQGTDILMGFHDDEPGFIATPENPTFIFGDHTCITHLSCQSFDISQNVIPLKGRDRPTIWTFYALQGIQTFQEYRRHWAELIVKEVIYPPAVLCEHFSETVTGLIRLKEQLHTESTSLKEIRDALLPKLLSGELSVLDNGNQPLAGSLKPLQEAE